MANRFLETCTTCDAMRKTIDSLKLHLQGRSHCISIDQVPTLTHCIECHGRGVVLSEEGKEMFTALSPFLDELVAELVCKTLDKDDAFSVKYAVHKLIEPEVPL